MKQVKRCPRFTTIRMASDGNNEAIEKILEHYNAYISKACLRSFYDEYGGVQIVPACVSSVVYGRKDILFCCSLKIS